MRFPSLSRHAEPAPSTADDDADRGGTVATAIRTPADQAAERDAAARATTARSGVAGSRRARAVAPAGTPDLDRTVDLDQPADRDSTVDRDRVAPPDPPAAPAGPRPRGSLLATIGLIGGLAGLGLVLTGALAEYGIALGALGAVLAVLGLIATRRRHVAGKPDALLGMAFGLGAVVLGVLAMTGQYDWPTTDGDVVTRLREWLDSQFVGRP
ncbi:hypothetical protein GCM10011608_31420 [Micromonospora sonchi]|uniref:Thrombospondin n=1 Tax=Micromonospora sonchi TaxID=1763543 RepID=A0A917TYQ0_9ACTN|nr:hypothetical protein [Micromonospora sonchi]GGM44413.1 hypothetical protein GCM10011608_31420 [Micromonospora sonchi]